MKFCLYSVLILSVFAFRFAANDPCEVFFVLKHVTSAEFNLNSLNTTTKSLDTFNQNEIILNNTWDYKDDDDDPIIRHTLNVKATATATATAIEAVKDIRKLLRIIRTTNNRTQYLTNQESLKAKNIVGQQLKVETNKTHNQNSNHLHHFLLTTIKFNKRNNENNYDNFKLNNELKTMTTTSIYETNNDAKEIPTNETDVKQSLAELEMMAAATRRKDAKAKPSTEPENIYQVKYQRNYYAAAANSFGQMPQFQLQLYLHQQQPTTTTTTSSMTAATAAAAAAVLLPHGHHHFADYRLLFNAEHHTQFYLHTLRTTTTQNNFVTVATKQATTTATAARATATQPCKSFQEPDAHNRYHNAFNYNDKTANNDHHDDDDDAGHDNNEMQLFNSTANGRVLNILTDTIGAVFGVNTRPVAAIQDIQTEEIELFNGLSLRQSSFNPLNPCRILIHGWLGGSTAGIYNTLVPEYLKLEQGIFNVFTVDWGRGAMADYITASYRVRPVAEVVAKFIDFLHQETAVPFANIHVIGFSMGAHVAGIAGKYVKYGRLPVIYGLDPALPLFRFGQLAERLDATDADYVEVLHTSVGSYGYDHPLGHVDFYVNFGYNQPGCFFNECSHFRAFQIFAQTLRNEKLRGEECARAFWWDMIKHKRCRSQIGNSLIMGVEGLTSRQLALRRGVFYVLTNAQAPFQMT